MANWIALANPPIIFLFQKQFKELVMNQFIEWGTAVVMGIIFGAMFAYGLLGGF